MPRLPASVTYRSPRHRNVLGLGELHEAFMRAFAAEPGLIDAAERRRRIRHQTAIESDHTEVEFLRHPHAAAQVLGIEIGDKAVFGVVGAGDDFVLRFEGLNRRYRPE